MGENRWTQRKTFPSTTSRTKITHGLTWNQTKVSAVDRL